MVLIKGITLSALARSSALGFGIAILVGIAALYAAMGIVVLLASGESLSAHSVLTWLASAAVNSDVVGSASNSLSVVLGIPTALLGTLFALVIAERAHRVSKQTRDLAARAEQTQQRQNRIEVQELLESRFKPAVHLLNQIDAELTALNFIGVNIAAHHHLDHSALPKTGEIELADIRALEHRIRKLAGLLDEVQADPVARDTLNKCWTPQFTATATVYSRVGKQLTHTPIQMLMSALASYEAANWESFPRTIVGLGRYTVHREWFGLMFVGWLISKDYDQIQAGEEIVRPRLNSTGLLLTDLWLSFPTPDKLIQAFDDYRYGALAEIDPSLLSDFVASINYAPYLSSAKSSDFVRQKVIAAIEFYQRLLSHSKIGAKAKGEILLQRRARALYLDLRHTDDDAYTTLLAPSDFFNLTDESTEELWASDAEAAPHFANA